MLYVASANTELLLYVITASVELCVLCIVSISVKKSNVISAGAKLCV